MYRNGTAGNTRHVIAAYIQFNEPPTGIATLPVILSGKINCRLERSILGAVLAFM
jgi:hypothetical protein